MAAVALGLVCALALPVLVAAAPTGVERAVAPSSSPPAEGGDEPSTPTTEAAPTTTTTSSTTSTTLAPTSTTVADEPPAGDDGTDDAVPPSDAEPVSSEPPPTPEEAPDDAADPAAPHPGVATAGRRCRVTSSVRPGTGGGPAHLCVERRLAKLGYAVRGPNRFFDPVTLASLRRFAADRHVPWRGVVTPLVAARLGVWAGPRFAGTCSVPASVRPGASRADRRRCVERRLAQLGFDVLPDGLLRRHTFRSLRHFARHHDVPWRGVVTPLLAARLGIWSGPRIRGRCTASSTIREGVRRPGALCVEKRLAQLGYDVRGPNRYFDGISARSLRRYQAANGLYVDGLAGRITLSALGIWKPPPTIVVRPTGSIRSVGRRQVALTFDDGPSPYTAQILDVLRRHRVPATFFVVGVAVSAWKGVLARAVRQGHSVQNHTWSHPALIYLGDSAIRYQLDRNSAAIKRATGRRPRCYRPPYGASNDRVRAAARAAGMRAEIGWDVDPSDYARPAAWTIVARVLAAADGGSVLPVMHDGGGDRSNTVAALTPIIQGLKARGYKFVRLCD